MARRITGSNGASASDAVPVAAPASPLALSSSSARLPPACKVNIAGVGAWPTGVAAVPGAAGVATSACVSDAVPLSANGRAPAIVRSALARPNGVLAEASCKCQLVLSPYSAKRRLSMTVVPVSLAMINLSSRASDRLRRNGDASEAGMVVGSSDLPVLRTVSAATCSSLICRPSEKYCNGDQLMSMLCAVTVLSGVL